MLNLVIPLILHVLERSEAVHREADEEDVGLRVAEGAQAVVVLLSGSVPQAERHGLVVDHDRGLVVVEDRGDVLGGEGVGGVGDEHAGLTDGTVA